MNVDWRLLYKPIATCIGAIAAGVLLLWLAAEFNQGEYRSYTAIQNDYKQAKEQYEQARRDKQLYRQYLSSYVEYLQRGIIGKEQRLSWIEILQQINKHLKLPSLRYEISPQQTAKLSGLNPPGNITIHVSTMQLTAGLLHENDLVDLFGMLQTRADGHYRLESCEIISNAPAGRVVRYRPGAAYLDIECVLNWYTVKVAS